VIPRVVIAAPMSGSGKTTITTGLVAALARRGERPAAFKVGPDFIDPSYHRLATGRPARNLDAFMSGEELVRPLFRHGAHDAGIAVIEGVMGMFDGRDGTDDFASTAHVARLIDAPVVLVVDARAMAGSVAALASGFASYDTRVRVAAVVLNRVGSDRHERILRDALDRLGLPVVGVLPRDDALAAPERHLGLVPAAERGTQAGRTVAELGERIASACDLNAIVRIARSAPALGGETWSPAGALATAGAEPNPAPAQIAVAAGSAFTFRYEENLELLRAAGAELIEFDPLTETLPDGAKALYLGGGFPETFASELSANGALRGEIAGLAASDGPILAECGGLLFLCRELDGRPMCGVIDADARMGERLTLGYREAQAASDSVLARRGWHLRGHEFHYSRVAPGAGPAPAWMLDGPRGPRSEGFVRGSVHASYLHCHWAACPRFAARFVASVHAARTALAGSTA